MQLDGFGEYLDNVEATAGLELPIGGRTYTVRPPAARRGGRIAMLWASNAVADPAARARVQKRALGGDTFAELMLGKAVVRQMTDDDVHPLVIAEAAGVAYVAWMLGEKAANDLVARKLAEREAATSGEAPAPTL